MTGKRSKKTNRPMKPRTSASNQTAGSFDRRKRLAEELRANLQKRKAQARSRRSGEADSRPEGLAGTADRPETDE